MTVTMKQDDEAVPRMGHHTIDTPLTLALIWYKGGGVMMVDVGTTTVSSCERMVTEEKKPTAKVTALTPLASTYGPHEGATTITT